MLRASTRSISDSLGETHYTQENLPLKPDDGVAGQRR